MTMDREVFLSLLAMDAYNRGTEASIGSLQESGEIGRASIITRESIFGDRADAVLQSWQAAGFYAIAYQWNNETVISYRGTNFPDLSTA